MLAFDRRCPPPQNESPGTGKPFSSGLWALHNELLLILAYGRLRLMVKNELFEILQRPARR